MTLGSRVTRLEKAAGVRPGDGCQCPMVAGVSGWRVVYDDADNWPHGHAPDDVAVCAKCGLERPIIQVVFDEAPWPPNRPDNQSKEVTQCPNQ